VGPLAGCVPSPMAHYAVAAAVLLLLGAGRREAALGATFALVPDLDALTAIPWAIAAPHVPLDGGTLVFLGDLLGHRGFSHTFGAALLAALGAGLATRRARWALLAGGAWSTHVLLDLFTAWPIVPFWPVSDVQARIPLVTTLDPALALVSTATLVALLGPVLAERVRRLPERVRGLLERVPEAWGPRLAAASLAVLAVHPVWIGAVAASSPDAGFGDTASANLPRTATVVEEGDTWRVDYRWAPGVEAGGYAVPDRANRTATGNATQAMDAVDCTLDHLGPYGVVDEASLVARPGGEGLHVDARDVLRNATRSGPHMVFHVVDGEVVDAWTSREGQDAFTIHVPEPVLEAAPCP